MTISFEEMMQRFSPEQRQQIQQRVTDLIAEDPQLQTLLAEEYGTEGYDISELFELNKTEAGEPNQSIAEVLSGVVTDHP
jgi:hypothetical protein